jgi:prepilin-type N-terminal cleavage/methylation domain-containing protein
MLSHSQKTSAADGHAERGFTLIELMITTMLFLVVIGVIFALLFNQQKAETYVRGRGQALDDMRITMDRMTKELRQATSVVGTPTSSHIEFLTYQNGATADITYDASGTKLTRKIGSSPATTVQTGLTTTSIFEFVPSTLTPQVVDITLVVAPPNLPNSTVTLDGEVHLRNAG